jgi:hypothetical protein
VAEPQVAGPTRGCLPVDSLRRLRSPAKAAVLVRPAAPVPVPCAESGGPWFPCRRA